MPKQCLDASEAIARKGSTKQAAQSLMAYNSSQTTL